MRLLVKNGEWQNNTSSDNRTVFSWTDYPKKCRLPITLVCHSGKVDISTFDQSSKFDKDILKFCSDVQGGLVTLDSIKINPICLKSGNNTHLYRYPISLSIADTMCHSPDGKKSLEALGNVIGFQKLELSDYYKSNMGDFFSKDPLGYIRYSSRDSLVTLLYYSSLWGYNQSCRVTLSSVGAHIFKNYQTQFLNEEKFLNYDHKCRGLQKVTKGKVKRYEGAGFLSTSTLEALNSSADMIQRFCSQAYSGGYNSCVDVGYYPINTFDYDLSNAYPSAMCLVPDLDWESPVKSMIRNEELSLSDFLMGFNGVNPIPLFVGDVSFEFPPEVKYPCFTHNDGGVPVYLQKSDGLNAVYVSGPEIVLALQLGAKIFCKTGFWLNPLIKDDGSLSYSMRHAVKQMVSDRNIAKVKFGEGSLEELLLKIFVNSVYGKNAQNVIDKSSWSAYEDDIVALGCSVITNPFSAMMITSIVRCELLAAQNQCETLGYKSLSVTTDGFISDIPFETLRGLDLYGIKVVMDQIRLYLTDGKSAEMWEIKHEQDDLLNLCTRGNVSLSSSGVCAHNSAKSGIDKKDPDYALKDRHWLYAQTLSRTGAVVCKDKIWTKFKDLAHGYDFVVTERERNISMDFDMKRRPVKESFEKVFVPLDGVNYEMMNFTTLPFETLEDFSKYRRIKKNINCLRTESDWDLFFNKLLIGLGRAKPRGGDLEWVILFGVVAGHRAMFWNVPQLENLRGQDRLDWINTFNDSKRAFRSSDWKNAGVKNRQSTILDKSYLENKLKLMTSVI